MILTDSGLQRSGTLLHWFVVVVLLILEDLDIVTDKEKKINRRQSKKPPSLGLRGLITKINVSRLQLLQNITLEARIVGDCV